MILGWFIRLQRWFRFFLRADERTNEGVPRGPRGPKKSNTNTRWEQTPSKMDPELLQGEAFHIFTLSPFHTFTFTRAIEPTCNFCTGKPPPCWWNPSNTRTQMTWWFPLAITFMFKELRKLPVAGNYHKCKWLRFEDGVSRPKCDSFHLWRRT